MKLLFDREVIGKTTRLVLEIESREGLDQFALNMMNHNDIECLVPVELAQHDNRNYLQYDITDMDTLDNRLSAALKKNQVIQILNSIISAFEETDAYMLPGDGLLLETGYVYVDRQDRCIFLYLPFEQEDSVDRVSFLRKVAEQIPPDYEEQDTYLFHIFNAFNRGAIKKVADLKELLRKNSVNPQPPREQEIPVPVKAPAGNRKLISKPALEIPKAPTDNPVVEKPQAPASEPPSANISFAIPGKNGDLPINIPGAGKDSGSKKKEKEKKKDKKKDKKTESKMEVEEKDIAQKEQKKNDGKKRLELNLFGKKEKEPKVSPVIPQPAVNRQEYVQNRNDDMYESYEQTVVMPRQAAAPDPDATIGMNGRSIALLERKRTGECFEITRSNTVLGSGSIADCQIAGNKAISRTHATISIQNGVCFLTDNHSSNGTWVNGSRLIPEKAVEIRSEALIKMANEEFVFRTR